MHFWAHADGVIPHLSCLHVRQTAPQSSVPMMITFTTCCHDASRCLSMFRDNICQIATCLLKKCIAMTKNPWGGFPPITLVLHSYLSRMRAYITCLHCPISVGNKNCSIKTRQLSNGSGSHSILDHVEHWVSISIKWWLSRQNPAWPSAEQTEAADRQNAFNPATPLALHSFSRTALVPPLVMERQKPEKGSRFSGYTVPGSAFGQGDKGKCYTSCIA